MARPQRVSNNDLTARRSHFLRAVSQAADNGHAGETAGLLGCCALAEEGGGGLGDARAGPEGGQEGHLGGDWYVRGRADGFGALWMVSLRVVVACSVGVIIGEVWGWRGRCVLTCGLGSRQI